MPKIMRPGDRSTPTVKRLERGRWRAMGSVKLPDGSLKRGDVIRASRDLAIQALSEALDDALAAAGHSSTLTGPWIRAWLEPRLAAAADPTVPLPRGQIRRWTEGSARNYRNALCNIWPESAAEPRISKDGSYDRRQADRSMIAGIGEVPMGELTVEHVEDLYSSMVDGQSPGFRAVELAHALLSQALDAAVTAGHLSRNPARSAALPMPPEGKPAELAALTPETAEAVRQALLAFESKPHVVKWRNGSRASDAWTILGGTGLRIGELLALRISDVRLATRQIIVAATVSEDGGLARKQRTKSGKRRVLTPGAEAWAVIERRVHEALDAGQPSSAHLLPGTRGGLWSPSGFRRTLRGALKDAKIRQAVIDEDGRIVRISSHAQRRTVATKLAEQHGVVAASRFLGHSSTRITEAAYVRHLGEVPAEISEGL